VSSESASTSTTSTEQLTDAVAKLSVSDGASASAAATAASSSDAGKEPASRLEETTTELEVISSSQYDASSPLFSTQGFEDPELQLTPELLKGVYALKFKRPSRIQATTLPIIIKARQHLIAQAQNGTGKTGAFALSMLRLVDPAVKSVQALLICPTREIARKNAAVIDQMAQFTGLPKCMLAIPDAPDSAGSPIVVGTAGKVLQLFQLKKLKPAHVKMLVLDEADQMIDLQGQQSQTEKIKKDLPPACQILLFSATYSDEVAAFASKFVPQPRVEIRLKRQELSLEKVAQFYVQCGAEANKFQVLDDIYGYLGTGKSVIFVQTKDKAALLAKKLTEQDHVVGYFSSELSTQQRDAVMDDFEREQGKTRVLVATNVLSRGVDVKNLTLVVNYEVPLLQDGKPDPETYLHRIGRTGRFGASGIAINLVHDAASMAAVTHFENYYSKKVNELKVTEIEKLGDMLAQLGR
jgi:ATP-dependent RNA helicase DDX19/DBP5